MIPGWRKVICIRWIKFWQTYGLKVILCFFKQNYKAYNMVQWNGKIKLKYPGKCVHIFLSVRISKPLYSCNFVLRNCHRHHWQWFYLIGTHNLAQNSVDQNTAATKFFFNEISIFFHMCERYLYENVQFATEIQRCNIIMSMIVI